MQVDQNNISPTVYSISVFLPFHNIRFIKYQSQSAFSRFKMCARMSVSDAAGNLKPYHYPYNFVHKVGQLPVRFFLARCVYTRRVAIMAFVGIFPFTIFQGKVRSKDNKETWRKSRAHYDHRFFRPPVMPQQSF